MKLYIFEECWIDGQRWDICADTFEEALMYFRVEHPHLTFTVEPSPLAKTGEWDLIIPAHDGPMYICAIEKELHKGIL